jgi:hypothetical protein
MLRLALLVAVVGSANAGDGGSGGGLFTSTARYVRLYEVERSLAEVLQVSETVRRSFEYARLTFLSLSPPTFLREATGQLSMHVGLQ